jgi:hypothetical protein
MSICRPVYTRIADIARRGWDGGLQDIEFARVSQEVT